MKQDFDFTSYYFFPAILKHAHRSMTACGTGLEARLQWEDSALGDVRMFVILLVAWSGSVHGKYKIYWIKMKSGTDQGRRWEQHEEEEVTRILLEV